LLRIDSMTDRTMNTSEFIEELKDQFGAEPETYHPHEEELQFMDERNRLEEEVYGDLEAYVEKYELLKAYGLEEKLINRFEWFILFYLENKKEELLQSPFYRRFKEHKVVKKTELEYERRKSLEV